MIQKKPFQRWGSYVLSFFSLWLLFSTGGCAGAAASTSARSVYDRSEPQSAAAYPTESAPAGSVDKKRAVAFNAPAPVVAQQELSAPSVAGQSVQQRPAPSGDADANTGVAATTKPGPLLIYEAKLALAVYEVDKSLDAVEALAKQAGGYLVQRHATSIVVRVPAAGFDGSLKTILKMGGRVAARSRGRRRYCQGARSRGAVDECRSRS